jgi:hypothetical protein
MPEEEREAIEAFEAASQAAVLPAPVVVRVGVLPAPRQPSRKAA